VDRLDKPVFTLVLETREFIFSQIKRENSFIDKPGFSQILCPMKGRTIWFLKMEVIRHPSLPPWTADVGLITPRDDYIFSGNTV
jgi:hypothetical protein